MALKLRDLTRWSEAPARDVDTATTSKINVLRGLAARATTPLLPDDYLKLLNPLWSARELRGEVVEVRRETEDSATVTIKPGWGFSADYRPGQYVGIARLPPLRPRRRMLSARHARADSWNRPTYRRRRITPRGNGWCSLLVRWPRLGWLGRGDRRAGWIHRSQPLRNLEKCWLTCCSAHQIAQWRSVGWLAGVRPAKFRTDLRTSDVSTLATIRPTGPPSRPPESSATK
jgi:hypothetical protein